MWACDLVIKTAEMSKLRRLIRQIRIWHARKPQKFRQKPPEQEVKEIVGLVAVKNMDECADQMLPIDFKNDQPVKKITNWYFIKLRCAVNFPEISTTYVI